MKAVFCSPYMLKFRKQKVRACQSMAHLDGGDVLCYDVCCVGSRVEQSTLKPVSEDKQYSRRGDSQKLNTPTGMYTLFLAPPPPTTNYTVWSYGLLKSQQSICFSYCK